jgi:hypothetical protein
MVAVLSRDYFQSEWCRLELALMHHREKSADLRNGRNSGGLIIPLVIDDGDHFPPEIQAMQSEPLHRFANPFIRTDSPKQEELAEVLKDRVCPAIERALANVPTFDPAWEQLAHAQFKNQFHVSLQQQTSLPSIILSR